MMNKFSKVFLASFLVVSSFIPGCGGGSEVSDQGGGGCDNEERYISECFSASDIVTRDGVQYATSTRHNGEGESEDLHFNIAYPSPEEDTLDYRPLVILIHGGGFNKPNPTSLRKNIYNHSIVGLAQRGFVAATIDYRLGRDESLDCEENLYNTPSAIYRASQDALSAVAYFKENAAVYGIDKESVFIGGDSAGAITALHAAMAEQSKVDELAPYLHKGLGPLHKKDQVDYTVKGVASMWGAVLGLQIIRADVPVIAFHGTKDVEVPYESKKVECDNVLDGYMLYGSLPVHNKLKENNVCTQLYAKAGGGHGVFLENQFEFLIEKTSSFFKSVLDGDCVTDFQEK